jgi:hypothetical protein
VDPEKKCIKCGGPIEAHVFESYREMREKTVARRGEHWADGKPISKEPKVCFNCLWRMLEGCDGEGPDEGDADGAPD